VSTRLCSRKVGVLLVAVLVHAAAGVAGLLVAVVERVVLVEKPAAIRGRQIGVALQGAALAAVGLQSATGRRTGTQAWQPSQWGR
jgi:uncharacterized membrane protein